MFENENIAFPNDQNLISKGGKRQNKISQYFESFQRYKKSAAAQRSSTEKERHATNSSMILNQKERVHTSGGVRTQLNLEQPEEEGNKRCRTAVANNRYHLKNMNDEESPEIYE